MEIRVKVKKKGQLASSHGKDYASGVNQEPLQMQSCEPPAALNVLLWPVVSPKNRVGGSPAFSFVFTFQFIGETLDAPAENGGCGYDFASGVHKYLYAADDPVDNSDPSGNDYGDFDINLSSILAPLIGYAPLMSEIGLGVLSPVPTGTWHTDILENNTPNAWIDVYYKFDFINSTVEQAVVDRYLLTMTDWGPEVWRSDDTPGIGGRWFPQDLTAHAEPDAPEGLGVRFFGRLPNNYHFKWKLRCTSGSANGKILSVLEKRLHVNGHKVDGSITYTWLNDN